MHQNFKYFSPTFQRTFRLAHCTDEDKNDLKLLESNNTYIRVDIQQIYIYVYIIYNIECFDLTESEQHPNL